MIKWIIIGILVLIALFDYALLVACSHMEEREQYQYEEWKKRREDDE